MEDIKVLQRRRRMQMLRDLYFFLVEQTNQQEVVPLGELLLKYFYSLKDKEEYKEVPQLTNIYSKMAVCEHCQMPFLKPTPVTRTCSRVCGCRVRRKSCESESDE